MEYLSEIRMLRKMPINHLDDFIEFMVERITKGNDNDITEKKFYEMCERNEYLLTEPEVFRKKFMVWCISS